MDVTTTSRRDRVTGAQVAPHNGGDEFELRADFVVDATGGAARTPALLERLGYPRPVEDNVTVHLKYSSQLVRLAPDALREIGFIVSPVPGRPKGAALARCEHDTWMLTVFGMAGNDPPDTFTEICDFAAPFAPAHAMAALRSATPLAAPTQHRYPSSRWYRYDRARRLPDGLLVVGDAVCSFNPIYAQGMTVAAFEALPLRHCLSKGTADLPRRFFKASAKPIRQAWQQAVGGDLSLPEIEGPPPPPIRLMNHYVDRILTAAEYDISVFEQFIRVAWLVDSPARMLRHDRAGDGGQASRTGRRTDSGAGLDVVLDVVAESAVQQLLRNAEHPADLAPRRPDRAGPSDRQSTTLFWSNVII